MRWHPHAARWLLLALSLSSTACLSDLNAYGLRAEIGAQEEPLRPEEIEKLRDIARDVAKDLHLMEPEECRNDEIGEEILDMYVTPERPALGLALYVAGDQRRAHIQVGDWDSTGSVNARTKRIMERVRREIETTLPHRSYEIEARDMGFWRP